ncbi:MAG: SURF1 family protein [Alphaproteobacteria bacterium]|nr:SURF1 family protein [Alphaproteobacteria bacterium]
MRFHPTLWPTVFTIPALIALLALGTWQVERLGWKQELIDRLQARSAGPAVDLPVGIDNAAEWEFRNVRLKGRYLHDKELYLLGRSRSGEAGVHVLTPLVRDGRRGVVLVDRGWVPPKHKDPATRAKGQIAGTVAVEGLVRIAKPPGFFTPDNDPGKNLWFFFDPVPMAAAAGLGSLPAYYVLSNDDKLPGGLPKGRQWRLDIRNDHLEYAITWYSFAVALLVIYVVYHRQKS